jgi:hypothetical protein
VTNVEPEDGELTASFDERLVTYGFGELNTLVPAYAATIHKSQGSEYPAVLIPVLTQHYPMLQRNLLYTGVTRGKKHCRAQRFGPTTVVEIERMVVTSYPFDIDWIGKDVCLKVKRIRFGSSNARRPKRSGHGSGLTRLSQLKQKSPEYQGGTLKSLHYRAGAAA